MNDKIESYIEEILRTTLVLDDGTRLKPIYIDWSKLSPEQRELTLAKIKQVSIEELKGLQPGQRLRLEFNDIPDDLEDMLTSLGGEGNPEFEWAEN